MSLSRLGTFISAYAIGRHRDGLADRLDIERITARDLSELQRFVSGRSPFYERYAGAPIQEWPVVDKALWMGEFDRINTVGAQLSTLAVMAARAEVSRDFSPTWNGHTIGLSTGTSGHRGLFLVSTRERTQWAATLIAKMLPKGLLSRERVGFVFRAGGPLYESVAALGVRFRFFDQTLPWEETVRSICRFRPSILVAQPQVLRVLTDTPASLAPSRVISVAEVLDELDRARLEQRFRVPIEQIYQATEGLLGTTCQSGTIHLNEPHLLIEAEWQDAEQTRFVPVITDLWRRAQPVIRYRLNDVLRVRKTPCPCGRAAIGVEAIEGRRDDLLWLRGKHGKAIPVFSDLLTRTIIRCVPLLDDYEIVELNQGHWRVGVQPTPPRDIQARLKTELASLASSLGAESPLLQIDSQVTAPGSAKKRRVRGLARASCAS